VFDVVVGSEAGSVAIALPQVPDMLSQRSGILIQNRTNQSIRDL